MTPDRAENSPDDEAVNAVLSHTESIDTTGLGILDGATEQVSLSFAASSEDDDIDDDVVGDEVPLQVYTIDVEPEAAEAEHVESARSEEIEESAEQAGPHTVEAEIIDVADEAHDVSDDDEEVFDVDEVEPTDAAPSPEPAPPAVAGADAVATPTGSIPTTRRQAQHPGHAERPDSHSIERVQTRPEVTLASKRLGEFEPDRESADLLTADRLLDPHHVVRPEPEGTWQHFVYSISGRRINLGDGKRARARKALDRRIAAPLAGGARFVPVLSRKGGVGKTTITTLLGMALADARDDRVIAVDANPDRGTLAERLSRQSGKTVRDLARTRADVVGYNDLSAVVARDETRLDVLASDSDPRVSEAFSDRDYHDVAALAAHYYSIVLTDTGTGIVHSVMGATLELADELVIVAGLSVDEARLASETLTWLETNGYSAQVRNAVVVLNSARPGTPLVQLNELEAHFASRVRAVVRMPYDQHIAAGSAIAFSELQPDTRQAARELAAAVVEGLRSLVSAA